MKFGRLALIALQGKNIQCEFFPCFLGEGYGIAARLCKHSSGLPYFRYLVSDVESGLLMSYEDSIEKAFASAKTFIETTTEEVMADLRRESAEQRDENAKAANLSHLSWVEKTFPSQRQERTGAVYLIRSAGRYKIGQSLNPEQRISSMTLSERPEILVIQYTPKYKKAERELHLRFADKRQHGEWFAFTDDEIPDVERAIRAF
jgi:hypothetical protein